MILTILSIDFPEIAVIVLVAVMFFGAEKIPDIARSLGKTMRAMRDASDQIKREIMTPVEDIKKETQKVNPLTGMQEEINKINPVAGIQEEIQQAKKEIDDMTGLIARKKKKKNNSTHPFASLFPSREGKVLKPKAEKQGCVVGLVKIHL